MSRFKRVLNVFFLVAVSMPTKSFNTVYSARQRISYPVAKTVTRIPAIVGGEADMPCGTESSVHNDTLLLVVWYRDDEPVYSYDNRVAGPLAHWIEDPYMTRTQWINSTATLHFHDIQAQDRATYRCRVDFMAAPTKNYLVALDVVELPGKPVILDEDRNEIIGIAGPYREGSHFKLICSVEGGYPIPRIQWLQGDNVLDTLKAGDDGTKTKSLTLEIRNATRAHLFATYTCITDNTLLVPPQKTTVKVDLYLKPLTIDIISRDQPLSVGRRAELWCKTTGSRPPATITWWLGGKKMEPLVNDSGTADANETESLLQWVPVKEQNDKTLTCRADHPKFIQFNIERKKTLNVYYMPETKILLGAKMNPNDIEEGDDVYFECEVDSNPRAYKIIWEHDGTQLQNNPANDIIITGNTNLALRNVSRHQAGQYTCTASNVEGDGKSQNLHLQVVYKPVCLKNQMKIIGAALQDPTTVVCEVDAYPPPDSFEWMLNNSLGSIKVDSDRFTVEAKAGRSVLTYVPVSDVDYGTLSCKALNLAGRQVSPCVYTLLPATTPDPPTNCTVYNLTDDSLDLLCLPGYEGGLQCVYVVEVWSGGKDLVVNASNGVALWNLRRLGSNKRLTMKVYAANARGRSEHITLTVETAFKLSHRTEPQEAWGLNWAVGTFMGAALTIGFILCLAFIATKIRHRTRDYEVALPPQKNQKVTQKRNSPQNSDDKNPDLIPLSKE